MTLRNKRFSKELAVVAKTNDSNLEGGNGSGIARVEFGSGGGGATFDTEWFGGVDKYGSCRCFWKEREGLEERRRGGGGGGGKNGKRGVGKRSTERRRRNHGVFSREGISLALHPTRMNRQPRKMGLRHDTRAVRVFENGYEIEYLNGYET
ncbi:hypothetical protein V6N13_058227 [Hibiscus sabdariffa]|uniref:Uncharacterized protein n=1 Tax=Hibiscus sabdariffa TaxID=183260 RepID=A0ABR2GHT0_9ROSI